MLFDLIAPAAYADTAATAGSMTGSLIMIGGFILIFYFMLWRPQSKRAKEHRDLVSSLGAGDEVMTTGGIAGRISEVRDDFIELTIANGVSITMQKAAVSTVLPKGSLKISG